MECSTTHDSQKANTGRSFYLNRTDFDDRIFSVPRQIAFNPDPPMAKRPLTLNSLTAHFLIKPCIGGNGLGQTRKYLPRTWHRHRQKKIVEIGDDDRLGSYAISLLSFSAWCLSLTRFLHLMTDDSDMMRVYKLNRDELEGPWQCYYFQVY